MFSIKEKQAIAAEVETLLLKLEHPEMPEEKPKFILHVFGKENWSFANIEPNWTFKDKTPHVNRWNEVAREVMDGKSKPTTI